MTKPRKKNIGRDGLSRRTNQRARKRKGFESRFMNEQLKKSPSESEYWDRG